MSENWKYLPGNNVVFRTRGSVSESMSVDAREFVAWLADGNVPDPADGPNLDELKQTLTKQIDDKFEAIYRHFTRFKDEYQAGEVAARAYKAAGYTGAVSVYISSYAQGASVSNQVAADTIITQADAAYAMIPQLRAIRMQKYDVLSASTEAGIKASYDNVMAQVTPFLNSLGLS